MFARPTPAPVRISTKSAEPLTTPKWMCGGERVLQEHIGSWAEEQQPDVRQLYPTHPDWHTLGLCNDIPGVDALFFGVDNLETPALSPTAVRKAREQCDACPVRRPCLVQALTDDERFGIWGGTTGRDRARMRKRLDAGTTVDEVADEWLR